MTGEVTKFEIRPDIEKIHSDKIRSKSISRIMNFEIRRARFYKVSEQWVLLVSPVWNLLTRDFVEVKTRYGARQLALGDFLGNTLSNSKSYVDRKDMFALERDSLEREPLYYPDRLETLRAIKKSVCSDRGYPHDETDGYLTLLVENWLNDQNPDWLGDPNDYYWE